MSFRFKQFLVEQDACPMKVGTDGVLLGAWCAVRDTDRRLLDIGTGTGVIALMLAQRAPAACVTALDIDPACVAQARDNVARSPWSGRVRTCCTPVQAFEDDEGFDLIVSNPPFYVDSLTPPDPGRTLARHTGALPFDELVASVMRLLRPDGRFSLILPAAESARFRAAAEGRLFEVRCTEVYTTPRSPLKRRLMTFARRPSGEPAVDRLTIEDASHDFSAEYRALTRDFYLKF